MPKAPEKRQFARYLIQLPLLHREPAPSAVGVGSTKNLSQGGACVELAERLHEKTPLHARLQTDRGIIHVEARVVWSGDPAPRGGILHGVAFVEVAPEHDRALCALLLSQGEVRQAGVRLPLELAVTCRPKGHPDPPIQGQTGNLSRGGLLVRLPLTLPPDTVIELTLHTRTGHSMQKGLWCG
jgi:c-di-GMP-binding flagellar brake protein YcgR